MNLHYLFTKEQQSVCYVAGSKFNSIKELICNHYEGSAKTFLVHMLTCPNRGNCSADPEIRQLLANCAWFALMGYRDAKRISKEVCG